MTNPGDPHPALCAPADAAPDSGPQPGERIIAAGLLAATGWATLLCWNVVVQQLARLERWLSYGARMGY